MRTANPPASHHTWTPTQPWILTCLPGSGTPDLPLFLHPNLTSCLILSHSPNITSPPYPPHLTSALTSPHLPHPPRLSSSPTSPHLHPHFASTSHPPRLTSLAHLTSAACCLTSSPPSPHLTFLARLASALHPPHLPHPPHLTSTLTLPHLYTLLLTSSPSSPQLHTHLTSPELSYLPQQTLSPDPTSLYFISIPRPYLHPSTTPTLHPLQLSHGPACVSWLSSLISLLVSLS